MEMKLALDVVGGFKVEHRGMVEVKVIIILKKTVKSIEFTEHYFCIWFKRGKE